MAQWSINIAVVAEPYFVPPRDDWVEDHDGLVTIISSAAAGTPSMENVQRGRGCVAARFGEIAVVGVYFSPTRSLAEFHDSLQELSVVVAGCRSLPVLVLGDFNAKHLAWGSRFTDARGRMLEDWVLTMGLVVLNRGSVPTCVRMRGESVVDISFASPALSPRVVDWRVMEEVETYSDHRYIRFDVSASTADAPVRRAPSGPRWALKQLDRELLLEASIVQAWVRPPDRPANIDDEAEWFREAMSEISDVAMPRVQPGRARRQVYWWSAEIASLRMACVRARRRYARHRRRRVRPPDAEAREAELYEGYRAAKTALKEAILRAKSQAREEMLETLNRDPWGRPYLMVRAKLRTRGPPLTQSLRHELVEGVVSALFPSRAEHRPPPMPPPQSAPIADRVSGDDDTPEVTEVELRVAVRRLSAKNTAPGPDGLLGKAWVLALGTLGPRLRGLLSACMEQGQFPSRWKTGKLVLIKKPGRPADSPSAYRPIVLLDEVGKLFERVIADRLVRHLATVGPDLADTQFGFRRRRSTVDAIARVGALATGDTVSRGGVVLAVSLDIANAFNTLPWSCIREALRYHGVPTYLRRVVEAYLTDRAVIYPGHHEEWNRREMSCGVPQGSVLGPLLWNIGYDWVLRADLPAGVSVVCYADDTLVLAEGGSYQEAAAAATCGVATVVRRIRRLGLEVALHKTEAMSFHGPRRLPPSEPRITVGGVRIDVGSTMKYLGLVLDSRWNFVEHFRRLAPKLAQAAAAFKRLLPNLGGPNASCRRLYAGVVRSMALYGAPVWASLLRPGNVRFLNAAQKAMANRLVRGYRTVSREAACLLAGMPPWDLEARAHALMHEWRVEAIRRGEWPPWPREIEARKEELRRDLMAAWRLRLSQPSAGHAVIAAVSPLFEAWLERRHGVLTFRLTQVLTGHGCFGSYLHRIRREDTPGCHHCVDRPEDTAEHTVEVCPAWAEHRRVLVGAIGGGDLSLPALAQAMVRSEREWGAVSSFCEEVMLAKEEAERGRRGRRSRPGRPRRRHSGREEEEPREGQSRNDSPRGGSPRDDSRPP